QGIEVLGDRGVEHRDADLRFGPRSEAGEREGGEREDRRRSLRGGRGPPRASRARRVVHGVLRAREPGGAGTRPTPWGLSEIEKRLWIRVRSLEEKQAVAIEHARPPPEHGLSRPSRNSGGAPEAGASRRRRLPSNDQRELAGGVGGRIAAIVRSGPSC